LRGTLMTNFRVTIPTATAGSGSTVYSQVGSLVGLLSEAFPG